MLDSLARFVYRRRRLVAIGGAVFFVIAAAMGGSVASRLPMSTQARLAAASMACLRNMRCWRKTGS